MVEGDKTAEKKQAGPACRGFNGGFFMEDYEIIGLYYDRSEDAIAETDVKYGSLCRHIAVNILASREDAEECVSGQDSVESELEKRRIEKAISDFLWSENETARWIFIRRYWYFDSIEHIVGRSGFSRSKVTSLLFRSRKRLRNYLQKEGISI